nr:MAG TPA: hypothetical protein [Caudoviricetes sp.]
MSFIIRPSPPFFCSLFLQNKRFGGECQAISPPAIKNPLGTPCYNEIKN